MGVDLRQLRSPENDTGAVYVNRILKIKSLKHKLNKETLYMMLPGRMSYFYKQVY
jgi:hypothetical protein